jgi:hypothetical protein
MITLLTAAAAVAMTAQWNNPGKDVRLKADEFAIFAWGPTSGDRSVLKDLEDCGFNLAGFVGWPDVPAVAKTRMQCIVQDGSIAIDTSGNLTDPKVVDANIAAWSRRSAPRILPFGATA